MIQTASKNICDLSAKPDDYYNTPRTDMMDFIPRDAKRVADIGCGEGCFGTQLKALGMEVWGVEMHMDSAYIAKKCLDKVLVGDVLNLLNDLPNDYFDCIIFNDVLEHLVDPYTILLNIKTKLNRNGVVVCSIPNVRYFYNLKKLLIDKQWRYEDCGILDKSHLRFFTEKSIKDTFDRLGYDIVQLSGINALTPTWKFKLLNIITCGHFMDTKFLQFACTAKSRNTS